MAAGVSAAEPLRKLFLMHPAYPTVLLELTSTTDTAVTSTGRVSMVKMDSTSALKHKKPFLLIVINALL